MILSRIRIRTHKRLVTPITKNFLPHHNHRTPFPTSRSLTHSTQLTMADKVASASLPASAPGENYEVRQTHPTEDYAPDPSKSLKLSPARQALVDDILDLYCCKPTVAKVKRYTPDCQYDDQFVYANDRYKMAAQWFALPKLFSLSTTNLLQIVTDEPGLIQWKYEQVRCSFYLSIYLSFNQSQQTNSPSSPRHYQYLPPLSHPLTNKPTPSPGKQN